MHKHEQIYAELLREVSESPADTQLPHERELAERFGASRTTVRQALARLIRESRVYAVRGHGTFVASRVVSKGLVLNSFSEDMRSRGYMPSTRVLAAAEQIPPKHVARMLELHADAPAIYLERLRLADGSPMCLETIWLPGRPFPNLLELDMEQSIYDLLWTRYRTRIDSADQRISATIADERTRDLLGMTDPSATIVISRRSFDNKGRVIEFAISRYHADRYDFAVTVHR